MKKAVFLDRDGVITEELGYICPIGKVKLFSYACECVKMIHNKGYLAIVITNQSGVARGIFKENELSEINNRIRFDTKVDAIYYCPHHPKGLVKEYVLKCDCRKPSIGLIERACQDYDIDLEHSFLVGDRATDILCGKNAGLKTVLVNSGYGIEKLEYDVKPDYVMKDLKEFATWLK